MSNILSLALYYLLFLLSAVFAFVVERRDELTDSRWIFRFNQRYLKIDPIKTVSWLLLLFFPVFMASIRHGIGTDYDQYEVIYTRNSNIDIGSLSSVSSQPTEYISNVMYKIAFLLFGDFHGYLFIASLITIWVAFVAMHYFSSEISFSLSVLSYLCLCYAPSLNIIRQMMAVSVVFFGLRYITMRKPIRYIITIVIATFFHTTALFALPFYFLQVKDGKHAKLKHIIISVFCLLIPFFFGKAFAIFTSIPIFSSYYGFFYSSDYGFLHVTDIVFRLPVALVILAFRKRLEAKNEHNRLFELLFLMEFISLGLTYYNKWLYRLMYYCIPGEIVLVSQLPHCVSSNNKRIISIGIVLYYIAFFFLNNFIRGVDEVFPFTTLTFQ